MQVKHAAIKTWHHLFANPTAILAREWRIFNHLASRVMNKGDFAQPRRYLASLLRIAS